MHIFFPLSYINKLHKSVGQLVASGASLFVVVFAVDEVDLKFPSFVQYLAGLGDTAFVPCLAKLKLVVH